jgi:hypothetical protein
LPFHEVHELVRAGERVRVRPERVISARFGHAVVARLVVLEPEVRDRVRQRDQKNVMPVVPGPNVGARLAHDSPTTA